MESDAISEGVEEEVASEDDRGSAKADDKARDGFSHE